MESRIKKLREKRGLIQAILAAELGITQQMLSKYERDTSTIKVDVLKELAKYFNVTTRLSIRTVRCEKRFDWANQNERNHR